MHEKAFESLLQRVIDVGSMIKPWIPGPDAEFEDMWINSNGFFRFDPDGMARYRQLVTHILKQADWGSKCSWGFIDGRIRKILEMVPNSTRHDVSSLLRAMVSELDSLLSG